MNPISEQMEVILGVVRGRIERGDSHDVIFDQISDVFGLSDPNGDRPIWFSRIIEGEMRDFANKEGFWYANSHAR